MSEPNEQERPVEEAAELPAETEAAVEEAVSEEEAVKSTEQEDEASASEQESVEGAEEVAEGDPEEAAEDEEQVAEQPGTPAEGEAEEAAEAPAVIPSEGERLALLEAIIYVTEEPLTADQIAGGLALPREVVEGDLNRLVEQYTAVHRGIEVRKVAGGYKMYTKAEHHEAVRVFVKNVQPKLKLSKPAFETLAVIAYKQPITVPEIQAIRGVNASGTIHTLLKHKLITSAGRKKVVGKPMMYKTTREFLVQFGLDDLNELPNLKEFEELSRAALGDEEPEGEIEPPPTAEGEAPPEAELAAAEEAAEDKAEAEEAAAADEPSDEEPEIEENPETDEAEEPEGDAEKDA